MADKEYRLKKEEEFNELINGEDEIRNHLRNNNSREYKYKNYGLLDIDWLLKYKVYLTSYVNNNLKKRFNYKINDMLPKCKEKNFIMYENNDNKKEFKYNLPNNFVLVTEKFINLLSMNLNKDEDLKLKKWMFKVIIKGPCIIFKYIKKNNDTDNYITICNENKGNSFDYIINTYNKEEMKNIIDLILNHDFWYFLQYMNLSFYLENQKIFYKNKKIGLFFRNCNTIRSCALFNMNKKLEEKKVTNVTNVANDSDIEEDSEIEKNNFINPINYTPKEIIEIDKKKFQK